ncbi:hypothetical protein HGP16_28500 [Rhizobium sp. P40RR-XXII]|uniref:hypothetical protein n=1 Tax=Rhizobium sp. P40RR-XXII TaxID=2726739 RepID=UPI001456A408|nr:hypothetical protein [Rhizobium sp. P40RR-XXII]NLS20469.1 hypothetical protein [Rhizobium sp. P40RR-XXII]
MHNVSFSFDIEDAEDFNHAAMLGYDRLIVAARHGHAWASVVDSLGHRRNIEIEVMSDTSIKATPI